MIELAAFAHGEWVRIHPFTNGNGRTSRIWANLIMARYGMPPVLAMRPRPAGSAYGNPAGACMAGDHKPLAACTRKLYDAKVGAPPAAMKTAAKKAPTKATGKTTK